MTPEEIELEETCGACPEQYDAKVKGVIVGYLRLRHGLFKVECPHVGGTKVFSAATNGDGMFEPHEREAFLNQAKNAICAFHNGFLNSPMIHDELAILEMDNSPQAEKLKKARQLGDQISALGFPSIISIRVKGEGIATAISVDISDNSVMLNAIMEKIAATFPANVKHEKVERDE